MIRQRLNEPDALGLGHRQPANFFLELQHQHTCFGANLQLGTLFKNAGHLQQCAHRLNHFRIRKLQRYQVVSMSSQFLRINAP